MSKSTPKTVVSIQAMRCDSTHTVMLSLQSASQNITCPLVVMPRCMALEATTSLFNKRNFFVLSNCLFGDRERKREENKKEEA